MRKSALVAMFAAAVVVQSAEGEKLRLKKNNQKAELQVQGGGDKGLAALAVGAVVGIGAAAWYNRHKIVQWWNGNTPLEQSLEAHGIDPNPVPVAEEIAQVAPGIAPKPAEEKEIVSHPVDFEDLDEEGGGENGLQLFHTFRVKPQAEIEEPKGDAVVEGEAEEEPLIHPELMKVGTDLNEYTVTTDDEVQAEEAEITLSHTLKIDNKADNVVLASDSPAIRRQINANCVHHSSCPYVCVATNSVLPVYINQYYNDVADGHDDTWSCHKTFFKRVQQISVAAELFSTGPESQACKVATREARKLMKNIKSGKAVCTGPYVSEVNKAAFKKGQKGAFYMGKN